MSLPAAISGLFSICAVPPCVFFIVCCLGRACVSCEYIATTMGVRVEGTFPPARSALVQVSSGNSHCVSPTFHNVHVSAGVLWGVRSRSAGVPWERGPCLPEPGAHGEGQCAAPERMPRASSTSLAGLAVGLGFGALAEAAKKSFRSEDLR